MLYYDNQNDYTAYLNGEIKEIPTLKIEKADEQKKPRPAKRRPAKRAVKKK